MSPIFEQAFRGLAVPLACLIALLGVGVMCVFAALLDGVLRGDDGKGGTLRCGSCLFRKRLRYADAVGQDTVELHTYYGVMYVHTLLLAVLAVCAGESTLKFGISSAYVPFVYLWAMFAARVLECGLNALWRHWCDRGGAGGGFPERAAMST